MPIARATFSISQSPGTPRVLPAMSAQRVGGDVAVDHGDGHAVVLVRHQPGRVGPNWVASTRS